MIAFRRQRGISGEGTCLLMRVVEDAGARLSEYFGLWLLKKSVSFKNQEQFGIANVRVTRGNRL
jgi:hypothetical protein